MSQSPNLEDVKKLKDSDITVSDLLAFFGFRYRNFESVPAIDAALEALGLTTEPPFATCGRGATVKVIDIHEAPVSPPTDIEETEGLEPGTLPQRPFLVSDLPSATAGLTQISSDSTLQNALHLMQTEGYSQIPVIDGPSSLRGIITWKSVATMYLRPGAGHTLIDAMATAETVDLHRDLFRELSRLCDHGYLLVRDDDGKLTGIITPTDITDRFHETALPFFLVGEIEIQLRSCLGALHPDAIRGVQSKNNKTGDIGDLMFGDYLKLLRPDSQNPSFDAAAEANWKALGWLGVDRARFIDHLTKVKNIRNGIAHFDTKPPSATDLDVLRKFSALLKQLM
ncbi:CBS domain-containing protein [Nocardia sp. NPDC005366]|uniref:CBS domain-containing protein n=1 Tax=Nocardia sp. NPDC005366 TaxID=3156878 RepID=UPI0033A3723F